MKMLYELTYMFRGHSGVPKDTLEQARILDEVFPDNFEIAVNPNSFLAIWRLRFDNRFGRSKVLAKIFEVPPRKPNISPCLTSIFR